MSIKMPTLFVLIKTTVDYLALYMSLIYTVLFHNFLVKLLKILLTYRCTMKCLLLMCQFMPVNCSKFNYGSPELHIKRQY